MATTLRKKLYHSYFTVLSTELNSLTVGSFAISAAQGSDATTAADLFCDFEITAVHGSALAAVFEFYLLRSADGSNYEDPNAASQPAYTAMAGYFSCPNTGNATKYAVCPDVPLPPGLWKMVLKNVSGGTLSASGSTVICRTYSCESI